MAAVYKLLFFFVLAITTAAKAFNKNPVTEDSAANAKFPATSAMIAIDNHGQQMNGHIYMASGEGPHPTVIFYHGYPGNEKNIDLMQSLRRAGFNTVFFHYRGSWGSEGNYSVDNVLNDSNRVIQFVREQGKNKRFRIDPQKISLFGHSFGGFAVLHVGAADKKIVCTVAASPADIITLGKLSMNEKGELPANSLFTLPIQVLGGYSFESEFKQLLKNENQYLLANKMSAFQERNLMLIAATQDFITPAQTIKPLADSLNDSGGFVYHLLETSHSYYNKRIAFSNIIVKWMSDQCR